MPVRIGSGKRLLGASVPRVIHLRGSARQWKLGYAPDRLYALHQSQLLIQPEIKIGNIGRLRIPAIRNCELKRLHSIGAESRIHLLQRLKSSYEQPRAAQQDQG